MFLKHDYANVWCRKAVKISDRDATIVLQRHWNNFHFSDIDQSMKCKISDALPFTGIRRSRSSAK